MDATIGHNSLADQHEADAAADMLHDAQELSGVVDAWVAQVPEIGSATVAEQARDLLARITASSKSAEDTRKAEKQPHLDAARDVDARYEPIKTLLTACTAPVKRLLEGWLHKERERQAAEAAAARAEAQRLAAEAAKAAAAQRSIAETAAAQVAVQRAEAAALDARRAEAAKTQVASAIGGARAATLRRTWFAKLVSVPLACRRYGNHPDVIAVLEKLASAEVRAAKGKISIPGFEVQYKESVA